MRTPTITLTKPRSFRLPPRAETRARLPAVAAKLREMQTPAVVIVQDPALVARVAELEAVAAHAKQQLHDHASQAWLEAESRLAQESMQTRAQRQLYKETRTAHERDNTRELYAPSVIATTDAVHLALPLNPRAAIPMTLPVMSQIRNWLRLKW